MTVTNREGRPMGDRIVDLDGDRLVIVTAGFKVQAVTATNPEDGTDVPSILVTVTGTDNADGSPAEASFVLPARSTGAITHEMIRHANDAV